MLKTVIRPQAEDDLEEAALWYDKRRPGLGNEFLACVHDTLTKLEHWPDFGHVIHPRLRRASVRRFPYGIFYYVAGSQLIVVGVFHARRSPRRWKARLE